MRQNGVGNNVQMNRVKSSFWGSVKGKALPATLYVLIYTAYTFAYANKMSVALIRPLYILFYAMTVWYMLKSYSFYNTSKFLKWLSLLLAMFVVYGLILYLNGTDGWREYREPSSFLLDYIPSLLPLFVFYYFGRRGIISEQWYKALFVLFLFNALMMYAGEQRTLLEKSLTGERDFISNSGYYVASLLPLICFFDKKRGIQYIIAALIIGLTVFCFKRGAILCVGIAFVYFMYTSLKTTKSINRIAVLLLVVIVIFLLYIYIENLMSANEFFAIRVTETMEGNSSGRDDIFGFFLNYFFSNENGLNFLWGNGAYGTVKIYGIEAHTDWLEMAIDFGVIGLIVFLFYWINVYKNISFAKNRISPVFYTAIMMCFIFNFSRTFFSMSIGSMSFITASILGSGMGLIDTKKKQILQHVKEL